MNFGAVDASGQSALTSGYALTPDTTIQDAIKNAALTPARASNETGSVDARPIKELIEADRYEKSVAAVKKPHRGLRFTKLIPPGTA